MKRWIFVLLLALTLPAAAGTREDVESASARCAAIRDDRAWLDCYYGAVQPMRAQLGLPPAPAAQVALVPAAPTEMGRMTKAASGAAPVPQRRGWLSGLLGSDAESRTHLASYAFNRDRLFTVTLSDGEVLEQRADDTAYAHWRGPAASHRVSLTTGAFGSQTLEDEDDGSVYQVRRIR